MLRFFVPFQVTLPSGSIITLIQRYLICKCLDCLWLFKLPCVVATCSHWSQGYLIFSCLDSLCLFRLPCLEATYSHWSQGYKFFVISIFLFLVSSIITRSPEMGIKQKIIRFRRKHACTSKIYFFWVQRLDLKIEKKSNHNDIYWQLLKSQKIGNTSSTITYFSFRSDWLN